MRKIQVELELRFRLRQHSGTVVPVAGRAARPTGMTTTALTDTPAERPMRADARRNRELILGAARSAFAEQGIDVPMDEIARRAGVGVGTVYRRFPTKDTLLGALAADHFEGLAGLAASAADADAPPGERVAIFLRAAARRQHENLAMSQILWRSPEAIEHATAERAALHERVDALVRAGVAAGELRPDARGEDVPPLMCGIGAVMASGGPKGAAWERCLDLAIDGLRFGSPRG